MIMSGLEWVAILSELRPSICTCPILPHSISCVLKLKIVSNLTFAYFCVVSVVKRVCGRSPHLIGKQSFEVCAYSPNLDPEVLRQRQRCVVKVTASFELDEDYLEMYFESHRRSGGGEIADIDIIDQQRVALITFSDHEGKYRNLDAPSFCLSLSKLNSY